MTVGPSANSKPITCPRCGYDQRGVMATWSESCPIESVCTECGLQFAWREVLNPNVTHPRWCIESPRTLLAFPLRFIGTAIRCWLPWLLWKRLTMTHPLHLRRLCAWIALWIVLVAMSAMLANGVAVLAQWRDMTNPGRGMMTFGATTSGWPVFLQATLLPFSSKTLGTYTWPPGVAAARTMQAPPYLAPVEMFTGYITVDLPTLLPWLLFIPVTTGVAFAALPWSRRRAKVRWSHIVRAAAYSYGVLMPIVAWMPMQRGLSDTFIRIFTSADEVVSRVATGLLLVVTIAALPAFMGFWWACVRRYLRMEHSLAVALSVTTIGILASMAPAAILVLLLW